MLRNMRLLLIVVVTSFCSVFLATSRICCPAVGRLFFVHLVVVGGNDGGGSDGGGSGGGNLCSTGSIDGSNAPHALSRFSRSVRWSVTNLIG